MGDLLLPALSGTEILTHETTDSELSASSSLGESSNLPALLIVLRQAIDEANRSTDSILTAIADSSRAVTRGDGVAIASRLNGSIVCRARSGEMAPGLGAPLSSEEGISGACLRTGKILVCDDTLIDQRVDADVCRNLGIRSIAVVPLRNKAEVFGILEAFCSRPSAFANEQLESLQSLAEIAEMAYASEVEDASPVADRSTGHANMPTPVTFIPLADRRQEQPGQKWAGLDRRLWFVGAGVAALLLMFFVIRVSWRQTGAEIASGENGSVVPSRAASRAATVSSQSLPQKPDAAAQGRQAQFASGKSLVKNAAEVQRTSTAPVPKTGPVRIDAGPSTSSKISDPEPPPVLELANASESQPLVDRPPAPQQLPQFAAPISGGAVEAVLIQKVSPSYPAQARLQGITGSVVLDATISADGSVRKIKVISGPPLLASSAAAAVREWKYTPAILNGKPIETQQRVTLNFRLP